MRVYGLRHKPTGEMLSEGYAIELGEEDCWEYLYIDTGGAFPWFAEDKKQAQRVMKDPSSHGSEGIEYELTDLEIVAFNLTEVQEQIPEGEGKE